jgi:hypothetical protein
VFSDLQRFTETKQQFIDLWNGGITTFCPSDGQWNTWLSLHSEAALLRAILKTTAKYLKSRGQMDADYLVKYCSSVANCHEAPC